MQKNTMNVFFTHTCLQSKTPGGQQLVELLHFTPFQSYVYPQAWIPSQQDSLSQADI